jgi:hypothetical protein
MLVKSDVSNVTVSHFPVLPLMELHKSKYLIQNSLHPQQFSAPNVEASGFFEALARVY